MATIWSPIWADIWNPLWADPSQAPAPAPAPAAADAAPAVGSMAAIEPRRRVIRRVLIDPLPFETAPQPVAEDEELLALLLAEML